MKFYLLSASLIVLLFSCTVNNKFKETSKAQFDTTQKKRINSGDVNEVMRIWKITDYNDSILLRQKSVDINFSIDTALLRTFVQRMHNTVIKAAGVGIAAPQVGILKNIIWVQRFDKEGFPWQLCINPKIIQYSSKKQPCPEGCLSIPDKNATTQNRAYAILLEYYDMQGEKHTELVEAFTAVIFQHEIDHLNGILFTDHLESETEN